MPKVIGVRFKEAGKIFTFMPTIENLEKGTKVVVETSRGKEIGFIATDVYEEVEEKLVLPLVGISRVATEKDIKRMDELMQKRPKVNGGAGRRRARRGQKRVFRIYNR